LSGDSLCLSGFLKNRLIAMFNNVQKGTSMANTIQQATPLPLEGYARLAQVLAVFPVSKSTWWAGCRAGKFPAPVKLGPRTTAWRVEDIRALIEGAK
jgi:predicted DNA-binding transcriptional regulator AlpA